jgi:hypothetical protein
MASEAYFVFGGQEIVNHARLIGLSKTLGISAVYLRAATVDWIGPTLFPGGFGLGGFGLGPGGFGGYDIEDQHSNITLTPWYDPAYPASMEFAGIMALAAQGIDDSSRESVTQEYVNDGGNTGKSRNATQTIVWRAAVVASTERGAEFGKRWLDRMLTGSRAKGSCFGADLEYYRFGEVDAPRVHRRNVATTRGVSVVRKRQTSCHSIWLVTFTMVAADPFEYGEEIPCVTSLGQPGVATGARVEDSGSLAMVQQSCPEYDYSPIFDPLYPALVASPTAPNFYPDGWTIESGDTFTRSWARVTPPEPFHLLTVPIITLTGSEEARMVRVSIWDGASDLDNQCGALFSSVVTYLPPDLPMYIDGEQKAAFVWDGFSPVVRRSDSLVLGPTADPVDWSSFNDPTSLLITLDIFDVEGGGVEGDGTVRASLSLVPKSD